MKGHVSAADDLVLHGPRGSRETISLAHKSFLPLNRRFAKACTDWQIRPTSRDRMASNDHADWGWDELSTLGIPRGADG
jgi:hypothetical protein